MTDSHWVLRIFLLLLWVARLVVFILGYLGILGTNIEQVAKNYDTPLTPEEYTFYSLAIIGLLQGLGCVYAVLPLGYGPGRMHDQWKTKTVDSVGPWWVIGFACELVWVGLWTQPSKSTLVLAFCAQLAGLVAYAIGYGVLMKTTADHAKEARRSVSVASYIMFYIPTAMSLAWLTMGACIGLMTFVAKFNNNYLNSIAVQAIALALIVLMTLVALLVEFFHYSIFYGLTLIWTITGIYIEKKNNKEFEIMDEGLLACLILICLATCASLVMNIANLSTPAAGDPLLENEITGDGGKPEADRVVV